MLKRNGGLEVIERLSLIPFETSLVTLVTTVTHAGSGNTLFQRIRPVILES